MKARIDAGTDAALIGAWDAARNTQPLGASDDHRSTLDADAAEGRVCLLEMGGDGGGPIDVYVDEGVEAAVAAGYRPVPGSFLLAVPTGALVVGGAEDYRSNEPVNTSDRSIVQIPPGDYEARWYAPTDVEREPPSEEELRRLVGDAELRYYDRMNRSGYIVGALILLLFPLLIVPIDWVAALAVTIVAFLGWFPLRARLLRRNERYQRLDRVVPAFRLSKQDAWLILELRRVTIRAGLAGGTASLLD